MQFVFDCNVLIRALLNESSYSGQALIKSRKSSASLLLSNPVLVEAIEVLMRPKFDKYVSREIRLAFLAEYEMLSTKTAITVKIKACRDPNDDMYLELALSGKADAIITNDPDLLVLDPFENISIISPQEFLERF